MALADIIKATVIAFAPELNTTKLGDAFWVDVLAFVNELDLTSCDTDADRRLARIYLAAHIGSMTRQGSIGTAGPVASESAGGIRRSYASLVMSTRVSFLGTTPYGSMYLDILGLSLAGLPMVI